MNEYWQGKLVRLRATEPDDAEHFYLVNRERDVDRNLDMIYPPSSMARQHDWVGTLTRQGFVNGQEFYFQIESLKTGEHVGMIHTHHCNPRVGTFQYGINVREQFRGNGYAADAILMVMRYYFLELRFQKADPEVFDFNPASIRLHEKLGFVLEGRRRRAGFTNGEFHDSLLYGMTIEEFRDLHPDYLNLQDLPIDEPAH